MGPLKVSINILWLHDWVYCINTIVGRGTLGDMGVIYDHLIRKRIFTLVMNIIFI